MSSYATESGLELTIERAAPKQSEEELRAVRVAKFVRLLDQAGELTIGEGAIDTATVRRMMAKDEDTLGRDYRKDLGEQLRMKMLREAV